MTLFLLVLGIVLVLGLLSQMAGYRHHRPRRRARPALGSWLTR